MKISKLFHWLYAILMLLPIFAIGVTCAYVIFNKNAYQSYYGETINEKSYEQTNLKDFDIGEQVYCYIDNNFTIPDRTTNQDLSFNVSNFEMISDINVDLSSVNRIDVYSYSNNTQLWMQFKEGTNTLLQRNLVVTSLTFKFIFEGINTGGNDYFTDLTFFNRIEYNNYSYLSDVFYYSIEEVEQSPLFSWSYDSFLATPITYISDLFGIASNSPVILLMSYWLAISIIWLVFDLVMYMPLLVHRWLDKGVLE